MQCSDCSYTTNIKQNLTRHQHFGCKGKGKLGFSKQSISFFLFVELIWNAIFYWQCLLNLEADHTSVSSVTHSRIQHRSNTINERFNIARKRILNFEESSTTDNAPSTSMRISNFPQTIQTNSGEVTGLLTSRSEIDSPSESQSRIFFSSTPIPEVQVISAPLPA